MSYGMIGLPRGLTAIRLPSVHRFDRLLIWLAPFRELVFLTPIGHGDGRCYLSYDVAAHGHDMRFHIVYLEYFLGLFEDDEGLVFQDGSAQDDNLFLGAVGVFRVPQRGGDAVPWATSVQKSPRYSQFFRKPVP